MKATLSIFAASIITLLTAQSAQAIVRLPGTFEPTHCGVQVESASLPVEVQTICVGQVTGSESLPDVPSVEFRLTDGTSKVFHVASTQSPMMVYLDGKTPSTFFLISKDGEQAVMKVIRGVNGAIESVSGVLGEMRYTVPQFEVVFVMQ